MIDFHRPLPEDRAWAEPLLRCFGDLGSEAAFGTYYLWQSRFDFEIAFHKGFFVAHSNSGYIFPTGEGNLDEVLQDLAEDATRRNEPLHFLFSERFCQVLKEHCPNCYCIEENRANADYLYRVSDLAELKGKKYHSKRNHIARFSKKYEYSFETVITDQQARECVELAENWYSANEKPTELTDELEAIRRAFSHRETLHLVAGLLRVDGKVIAFAAGEPINENVFDQHFEKALVEYDGAYAMINQAFMAHCLSEYEFVNREEDMGIEGLRKAKLSYLPEKILAKYTARCLHS